MGRFYKKLLIINILTTCLFLIPFQSIRSEEIPPPLESPEEEINEEDSSVKNEEIIDEIKTENSDENEAENSEATTDSITPSEEKISNETPEKKPTHHLVMNINGTVQIFPESDSSFEDEEKFKVNYEVKIEKDIAINFEKNTFNISVPVKIKTSGFISSGENFTCLTAINMKDLVFETSTEIKKKKETNNFILGLKLSEESAKEKWIFTCNSDGNPESLSSEGGFENYLWQIITEAKPALKSIVFKKFDVTQEIKMDIPIKPIQKTEEGLEPALLTGKIDLEIIPIP